MVFFAVLFGATVLLTLMHHFKIPGLKDRSSRMRGGMAAALLFAGIDHLLTPERYLPMMPSIVPYPEQVILFTGLCEIAGAIGLLLKSTRRIAGIMLAIYFVCVFPANIKNAIDGLNVEGLPSTQWYYVIRLFFQPIAIWWVLRATDFLPPLLRNREH